MNTTFSEISLFKLLLILLGLLLCSSFFSASETGFLSLNRYRIKNASKHNHLAKRILDLITKPERLLGTILIGNTFANTYLGAVSQEIGSDLFGEYGAILGPACMGTIILLFGEILPKTIAAIRPETIAYAFYWPLWLAIGVLSPLVWFSTKFSRFTMRLFGIKHNLNQDKLNKEELRTVVNEASGLIPKQHQSMLLGILELEEVRVEHIMVPRNEVIGIDLENNKLPLLTQIHRASHTLLPVYRNDLDNIEGVLHIRECLELISKNDLNEQQLLKKIQEPYFVPEGTQLHTQLMNFQEQKRRMGLVVDEYGDIQGLVTLQDILEEIVGEFTTNTHSEPKLIKGQDDGSYVIDGSASLREINKILDWNLPTEGPTTLNGLILEQLESIPDSGTTLIIGLYTLEILETKENMVKLAKIRKSDL